MCPIAASIATARWVSELLNRPVGGSTGTNVWAALQYAEAMRAAGETGSIVTLLCDGGERYVNTYFDDAWLAGRDIDIAPYVESLERFAAGAPFAPPP